MTETIVDKIVEFDLADWQPERDADSGVEIFSEYDAISAAVRMMSENGINISTIWHAHDIAIEFGGTREYLSLGILGNSAAAALMEAMQEISCIIDNIDGIECYISLNAGKHFFHIKNIE